MIIRQSTRATKCLIHIFYSQRVRYSRNTGVTLRSPRRFHNCKHVRLPTHAIVNSPTHFILTVAPSPSPVRTSHNHQSGEKTSSCNAGVPDGSRAGRSEEHTSELQSQS